MKPKAPLLAAWLLVIAVCDLFPGLRVSASPSPRERALDEAHREQDHVRYRFGACNDAEMDCSCFLQRLFTQRFRYPLPRTTLTQTSFMKSARVSGIRQPSHLRESELCAGDLIYTYQGTSWQKSPRHGVVYIGRGEVLHSSSSQQGVAKSPLSWVQRFALQGVYRPLGCDSSAPSTSGPPPSSAASRTAVDRLVERYYRTWETRDLQAYAELFAADTAQWRLGERHDRGAIVRLRQRDLQGLERAEVEHRIERLSVMGEIALVDTRVWIKRRYRSHSRVNDARESFVLRLEQGRWRIVFNENFNGD